MLNDRDQRDRYAQRRLHEPRVAVEGCVRQDGLWLVVEEQRRIDQPGGPATYVGPNGSLRRGAQHLATARLGWWTAFPRGFDAADRTVGRCQIARTTSSCSAQPGSPARLTAEYLARHAPADCRWALAGRNVGKLENVRAQLAAIDPALSTLKLLDADSSNPASLRAIAADARVIASTVGPYIVHGEPLVAACAEAGTDYLDLTGEPEFVDTMYLRYHEQAQRSGARLVHACGFDSIPYDIGAYYTVLQLPEGVPLTVHGYVEASGRPSGGTAHSALTAFSRFPSLIAAARERKRAEPALTGRSVHAGAGLPHRAAATGGWALPMPTLDPQIVGRSARALDRYGPDFRYTHCASVPHLWTAAGLAAGVGGLVALAQVPPARNALLKRMPQGEGPSRRRSGRAAGSA